MRFPHVVLEGLVFLMFSIPFGFCSLQPLLPWSFLSAEERAVNHHLQNLYIPFRSEYSNVSLTLHNVWGCVSIVCDLLHAGGTFSYDVWMGTDICVQQNIIKSHFITTFFFFFFLYTSSVWFSPMSLNYLLSCLWSAKQYGVWVPLVEWDLSQISSWLVTSLPPIHTIFVPPLY